MSTTSISLLLLYLFLFIFLTTHSNSKPLSHPTSPYISPTTFSPNYQNMLRFFKIFIYNPNTPFTFHSPAESLFYTTLQDSSFVTQNAEEAHLFFVPFPSDLSTRSVARVVRTLRSELPYWNRTLGADHFYLSCAGIGYESDRNLVELKKNSVQISCFPTPAGNFIPHKDISLPPLASSHEPTPTNKTTSFLGYARFGWVKESTLVKELSSDPEFLIESGPSDQRTYVESLCSSRFCLFEYGGGGVSGIGDALRFGCVPAVITDRPIQDLPFSDVLRWQDIAVFVGRGGVKELNRVLARTCGDRHEKMRGLGVTASQHFVWNKTPQPLDSFHTLMYQLWLRRHTIRYVRREWA